MICHEAQASLVPYLQNELEPGERQLVDNHLADCHACREQCDETHEVLSLFSSVGEFTPPPRVWENIQAVITQEAEVVAPAPVPLDPPSRRRLFITMVACAAAVLLLVLGLNELLQPSPVAPEALLQAGAATLVRPGGDASDMQAGLDAAFPLWPGDSLMTRDSRAKVALGAGTSLTLDSDTEVRLDRGRIHLERGKLLLEESGGRNWQLVSDRLAIKLIGTQVELSREGAKVRIRVLEGRVLVETGGEQRQLSGGEGLVVTPGATTAKRLTGSLLAVDQRRVLGQWGVERLSGQLTVEQTDEGGRRTLVALLRLTNNSTLSTNLRATGTTRKCWLQVTHDGKSHQIQLALGAAQDVVLGARESHTYRVDITDHFTKPGTYRLQARYLVGRTAPSGESPSHTVETPTHILRIR